MFSYYAAQHASSLFRRCSSVKWLYDCSVNPARSPGCLRNFSAGSNGYWNKDFWRNPDMQNGQGNVSSTYASGFGRQDNSGNWRNSNSMEYVREALNEDRRGFWHFQSNVNKEVNPDIVHIKHMRNNTFVIVTDSKGNRKCGASSGCLSELKGGPKLSRYAAEATAEHVGRLARNLGLKSVVMRVNGFTHFKKKRQSIMSFKEGFTSSRTEKSPIVYVEDTTRRAHNGCRLPKKRRV